MKKNAFQATSTRPNIRASIDAMVATLRGMGRDVGDIAACLTTWDYPTLFGTLARSVFEEVPQSLKLLRVTRLPDSMRRRLDQMTRTPKILGRQLGLSESVPLICMPHHDNHAWFSFAASPFADEMSPSPSRCSMAPAIADRSRSMWPARPMRRLYCNDSMFDSLGAFYSVISSTQGGWTWPLQRRPLHGRRGLGRHEPRQQSLLSRLKNVLHFGAGGEIRLNRAHGELVLRPLRPSLQGRADRILGEPLKAEQLWNPDAMLRVEDINHRPDTKDRLDKAAATQLVFEDALIHVVDHLLRATGANRLVLTGGVALNAVGNMRLLEHFDEAWFAKAQQRKARLHLWVPPTPGDPGVTIGAAWLFAHIAGAPRGAAMTHAFYCGTAPSMETSRRRSADDVASSRIGDISTPEGRDAVADLMAFMVAQNGVIALYQGAAETGPRALGHRSILANPCDPEARERLNERVKYREAIRPLAPMATLEAAKAIFRSAPGASDADYNAYNYMVLTAQSKPAARDKIPAVIHADGTGRIQIVREEDDPLTYAYLKALGRRIGVEIPSIPPSMSQVRSRRPRSQAIDTLRRSKGLDVVLLVATMARSRGMARRRTRQRPVYRVAVGMDRPRDRAAGMYCARAGTA